MVWAMAREWNYRDFATLPAELRQAEEYFRRFRFVAYKAAGYPLGKSVKGFKKWRKSLRGYSSSFGSSVKTTCPSSRLE